MLHPPLVETHTPGPGTRERVLRASGCPILVPYQIAHVGLAEAVEPYTMVRTDLPGSYFLVCFGVSYLTPPPPKNVQELIQEIRIPKGAGKAYDH